MPKRLRLLKITAEGYLVGSGKTRKNTHILIPHEAIVAVLTGLKDSETVAETMENFEDITHVDILAVQDAANFARRQLAGIAWRLGVCSWDNSFRAISHDALPFHASD